MLLYPPLHFQSHHLPAETHLHSPYSPSGNPPPLGTSWKKTRRNIVSKWWNRALELRHKRGLVKTPTSFGQLGSPDRIASAHATSAKAFFTESDASEKRSGTGASICPSSVLCQYDLVSKPEVDFVLKTLKSYGLDFGNFSDLQRQLQDLVDSMAKHRSSSAAKSSSKSSTVESAGNGQTPEQYLAAKRQEAVEAVMVAFNKWLDTKLAVISYAYEASGGSDDSSGGGSGWKSGDGNPGSPSGGCGRPKRQLSNGNLQDGSSPGGDGDGNGQDKGANKRARTDTQGKPKFACPFFQHDPSRHSAHRSCTGPGWPSIHRLKEHLTRIHRLKHVCPRCRESMEDATALEQHLRSDIPCTKRNVILDQGIDDAQEKKLKERRKTSATVTEEQKWNDIYMILFPNADRNALPSAYYDSSNSAQFAKSAAEWKNLKKRIQKDLPKAVQSRVEQRFEGLQMEVLHSLPEIVREEIFYIFKGFSQGGSAPGTPGPSSRSATPKAFDPAPGADDSKALNLETYFNDPNQPIMLFGGLNDFDYNPQLFPFDPEAQSDSGYASNSTAPSLARPDCIFY